MKIIRTCIISREKLEQKDLIQIVVGPLGKVSVNKFGKFGKKGRAVYFKNDKKVIEQFLKRPITFLNNFIKRQITKEDFEILKNEISKIKSF